jgi:hypothetical protein
MVSDYFVHHRKPFVCQPQTYRISLNALIPFRLFNERPLSDRSFVGECRGQWVPYDVFWWCSEWEPAGMRVGQKGMQKSHATTPSKGRAKHSFCVFRLGAHAFHQILMNSLAFACSLYRLKPSKLFKFHMPCFRNDDSNGQQQRLIWLSTRPKS